MWEYGIILKRMRSVYRHYHGKISVTLNDIANHRTINYKSTLVVKCFGICIQYTHKHKDKMS